MKVETLQYEADGLQMKSRLFIAHSAQEKRPGILLFPEATGLGEHALDRAERLAALGYAVLACDIYGDGALASLEEVPTLLGPLFLQPQRIRDRAAAGLAALLQRPEVNPERVAATGYCFGGAMALELARDGRDIAAVIGFHCHLATSTPTAKGAIKGKVLVCIGADDPTIDAAQRAAFETEMREAGADWQMNLYGGVVHSFTNPRAVEFGSPEFARYDRNADNRSWSEMLRLFEETLRA